GAHQSFRVVVRAHGAAFAERGSDDGDVLHDGRRRMNADLPGHKIDWLPVSEGRAGLQVDDPAGAERADYRAGFGVELDQPVSGRHVEHAIVAASVGPVRHAAARKLPWRNRGPLAFTITVRP